MEFGKTLREAREAKGYSISQLSEITRVMSQVIDGLENEDFRKIAAPIYGRGFVKLCCQALDLDPKPMIEEFMALYNGEKPPANAAVPEVPAEPVPPPPPLPPPPPPAEEPIRQATPVGADEVPVQDPQRDLFERPAGEIPPPAKTLSRFAPLATDDESRGATLSMPAIPWRLVALIIGAIAVIYILVIGGRTLYKTLSEKGGEPEENIAPQSEVQESAAPAAPRTPKAVKPLYID